MQRIAEPGYQSPVLSLGHWLFISCSFSCLLAFGRVAATGTLTYLFLLWNLFLAFVPYVISKWLPGNVRVLENKWMLGTALMTWLLFIPNSFYILTDLFHLRDVRSAPGWFDLLLLLSFAWNGLVLGILSVRKTEIVLQILFGKKITLLAVFIFMWLNAWGIFIGRYLRYNSWDVVTQPFSLFADIAGMVLYPFANTTEWSMITCYALFMTLLYITIQKLSENFYQSNK